MYIGQWKENGLVAKFVGETGDSAYHRQTEHAGDIKRKQTKNGKHLEIFHPDQTGDKFVFEVNMETTICGESES